MSDIFISYAKADKARAAAVAKALEARGWSVWWDRKIPPGKTFSQVIAEAIDAAKCVLVLWSNDAIKSQWVQEEAGIAKQRNILIPALIDPVEPPLGFRLIQAADMIDWKPASTHEGFTTLLDAISAIVGPAPAKKIKIERPPQDPEPVTPSDVQPEKKETPQSFPATPKARSRRPLITYTILAVVIAAAGIWFYGSTAHNKTVDKRSESTVATPEPVKSTPKRAKLYVDVTPQTAKIKITNYNDSFHQGIEVEPKELHLQISADGYKTKEMRVSPEPGKDLRVEVRLDPKPAELPKKVTNSLGMKFVYIASGTFTMGSPDDEPGRKSGETQHQVTLTKGFYMQTSEVTQGQWLALMGSNPSKFKACGDDCPIEQVSWEDVQTFIDKLNQKESDRHYRLPTEAQWEYAARAGSRTAFANGNITETVCGHDTKLDAMGWYCGNSGSKTHPVASKEPNRWGLYDMHGNVWEWCQDWYGVYSKESAIDPSGPPSSSSRVIRGGSWINPAGHCRSAFRSWYEPGLRYKLMGFRLVLLPGQ